MKFEEAWELMQKGKKVRREKWEGYWLVKNGKVFRCGRNGSKYVIGSTFNINLIISDVLADDWMLVEELKKVFISQPMAGKIQEQIIAERAEAVEEVQRILGKVEIIDTVLDLGEDALPLEYMGESIKLLANADAIYLMDGWDNARGCRIEHECAEAYGIPVILQ